MLKYDPLPWLIAQEGLPALRARCLLDLPHPGDEAMIEQAVGDLSAEQLPDGSFAHSPMKTAGILNLLADLHDPASGALVPAAATYLFSVLADQPGYPLASEVKPGTVQAPCDLCGFFGPYAERAHLDVIAWGASEMNHYRTYEPLLGPKSPVRSVRRSSLDRPGPSSCYAWGLIPLCYIIEALCSNGYAQDNRLQPGIHALLGVQRARGGWCRNLNGHPSCTLHALRALGAHPDLRQSEYVSHALHYLERHANHHPFAILWAVAPIPNPTSAAILKPVMGELAPHQRKDGSFGEPYGVERVAAVLVNIRKSQL